MPNIIAGNRRFRIVMNKILELLTFTFYRAGGSPEYEYSISRRECEENPQILEVLKETIKDWSEKCDI